MILPWEFTGYKLGWVETLDHSGSKRRLQAYFVAEDEGYEEPHMLVVDEVDGHQDDRDDEYGFLSYYGVALAWPLVWKVEGAAEVPEIRAWFPAYEYWGCR
jgi:hypothetical protein